MKTQNTISAKNEEQIRENAIVLYNFNKALDELQDCTRNHNIQFKRLRSSSAYVLETDNYYLLQSYKTVVAVIDKSDSICYDALRHVYGYTRTSAQHIAKFVHDYAGDYKFGRSCFRYYNI